MKIKKYQIKRKVFKKASCFFFFVCLFFWHFLIFQFYYYLLSFLFLAFQTFFKILLIFVCFVLFLFLSWYISWFLYLLLLLLLFLGARERVGRAREKGKECLEGCHCFHHFSRSDSERENSDWSELCLVSDSDFMEHFAFPGNEGFAADDQGAFSCIIHDMLLCLFIVCETMFAIVESRTRSTASACKSSPRKIFHWNSSRERRLKFIGQRIEEDNCEAERTSLSTAKATTLQKDKKAMGWMKQQLEIG